MCIRDSPYLSLTTNGRSTFRPQFSSLANRYTGGHPGALADKPGADHDTYCIPHRSSIIGRHHPGDVAHGASPHLQGLRLRTRQFLDLEGCLLYTSRCV